MKANGKGNAHRKSAVLNNIYTVSQKKLGHFFTAYNFRNIEQIFTKLGIITFSSC